MRTRPPATGKKKGSISQDKPCDHGAAG